MARVEIILETDGGGQVVVVECSAFPVTGGEAAAVLVQTAYVKAMGALGLTSAPASEEAPAPAPDTPKTEEK